MFEGGYEKAAIDSVSCASALQPEQIRKNYPTNDELRMAGLRQSRKKCSRNPPDMKNCIH